MQCVGGGGVKGGRRTAGGGAPVAGAGTAMADISGIIANAAKNVCNRAFLLEISNMIKEMEIPQSED